MGMGYVPELTASMGVTSLDASIEWYGKVLGFTLLYRADRNDLFSLLLEHFPQALVALSLLLACGLWHLGMRQGPLLLPASRNRRQMQEHLRGSADFLLRHNGQHSLLQGLQQDASLHCPATPAELHALPLAAQHLLWNPAGTLMLDDWRSELQRLQRGFQVLHDEGPEALKQCIYALLPPHLAQDWARQPVLPKWTGVCETCGDADCEQRLFSRLLQG